VPTQEALRLFNEVDAAIRQVHALTGSIVKIAEGQSTIFRFAATQSVGRNLVPRAIRSLSLANPGLKIFLDALPRVQHVEYLSAGAGECLVTLAEIHHPLARMRIIGQAPLIALVHRDHQLAGASRLSAADLADTEIIGFEHSGPHSGAIDTFFSKTTPPRIRAYVRFSDAAVALAAEGVAVALVDGFTASGSLPDGVVRVPLKDPPRFSARLYWNSERSVSRHVTALGDALVDACRSTRQAPVHASKA
jgi:DNA-binding transcriptional LysR family regulator